MSEAVRIIPHLPADSVKTVTIAANTSLSDVIDLGAFNLFAIEMPSAWDTATITFAASSSISGTFIPVYNSGSEVSTPASASEMISLGDIALAIAPLRYIKIRSGTNATPVTQTASRTLKLVCK